MIFVDTSAWHAILVPADQYHERVVAWLRSNPLPLVTTDYIVDETLTLLRARGRHAKAIEFGRVVFDLEAGIRAHFLTAGDIRRAWELFRDDPRRDWSFTDCASKALIERLHIKKALSLDRHFRELGVEIVPG